MDTHINKDDPIWEKILKILFTELDKKPVRIQKFREMMTRVRIERKDVRELLHILEKQGLIEIQGRPDRGTTFIVKENGGEKS